MREGGELIFGVIIDKDNMDNVEERLNVVDEII